MDWKYLFTTRDGRIGRQQWWLGLIPIIGGIWALVENGFLRGTDGPNQYGNDPLAG